MLLATALSHLLVTAAEALLQPAGSPRNHGAMQGRAEPRLPCGVASSRAVEVLERDLSLCSFGSRKQEESGEWQCLYPLLLATEKLKCESLLSEDLEGLYFLCHEGIEAKCFK